MIEDHTALTPAPRTFPPAVHASLAELRQLARSVKSLAEWKAVGRHATPDERQLAETQRQPHHCRATSIRTLLPCLKPRVLGMTCCRKHSGSTKHVIAKADRRLRALAMPVLARLYELALQDEHKPAAVQAAKDWLDRVGLGAVVRARVRASQGHDGKRITVQIGFLKAMPDETAIIVQALTPPEKPPEKE